MRWLILLQAGTPELDTAESAAGGDGSGLLLVFVFLTSTLLTAAAGFFLGSVLGRTEGGNLAATLATTRHRVDAASQRLRGVSARLVGLDRSARHAGEALVVASKLAAVANDLGAVERRAAARGREGSE